MHRESLRTDVALMAFGIIAIPIAISRLSNNIQYLPGDVRSAPWFDPFVSTVIALVGVFFFAAGAIRLLQGLRERNRRK